MSLLFPPGRISLIPSSNPALTFISSFTITKKMSTNYSCTCMLKTCLELMIYFLIESWQVGPADKCYQYDGLIHCNQYSEMSPVIHIIYSQELIQMPMEERALKQSDKLPERERLEISETDHQARNKFMTGFEFMYFAFSKRHIQRSLLLRSLKSNRSRPISTSKHENRLLSYPFLQLSIVINLASHPLSRLNKCYKDIIWLYIVYQKIWLILFQ